MALEGRGVQLIQKKKTIYPDWNRCFDAHLYEGRVIQMVLMERPNKCIADITIGAQALAEKCQEGGVASAWVSAFDFSCRLKFNLTYSVFLSNDKISFDTVLTEF